MTSTYWLHLFTVETWQEFRDHGGNVTGFSDYHWKTVRKLEPGDYFLCYLTRVSKWVGLLEVTGEPFSSEEPIWSSQVFPCRVPVKVVLALDPEDGIPVLSMRDQLTVFQGLEHPNRWVGPFRNSPSRWKTEDGEAVVRALQNVRPGQLSDH